jgi:hypothetical protein
LATAMSMSASTGRFQRLAALIEMMGRFNIAPV